MKAMDSRDGTIKCIVCNKVIIRSPQFVSEDAVSHQRAHQQVNPTYDLNDI